MRLCRLLVPAAVLLSMIGVPAAGAAPFVYATDYGHNKLLQFDAPGGVLSPLSPASIAIDPAPQALAVSPNGKSAYIAYGTSVRHYAIGVDGTLTAKLAVSTSPDGGSAIAVSPDGLSVYVAADSTAGGGVVRQYTAASDGSLTPKVPATVPSGASPSSIAYSRKGPAIYVSNFGDDTVSQYAVGAGGLLTPMTPATVAVGDQPTDIVASPSGDFAYVASRGSGDVSQFSASASGTLAPLSPPSITTAMTTPYDVAVHPDGHSLYVGHLYTLQSNFHGLSQYTIGANGTLAPKTPALVFTYGSAGDLAISADGLNLYSANRDARTVSRNPIGTAGRLGDFTASPLAASGADINTLAAGPNLEPFATITQPVDGAALLEGTSAVTAFTCDTGAGGAALTSCRDQFNRPTGGALDTTPGNHTLTVTALRSDGHSATRTVSYSVGGTAATAPTASAQTVTTNEDTAATFSLNASDADGDPLTVGLTGLPLRGTVTCAGTSCTYTPAPNLNGIDSFDYTVTDGKTSVTATVTVKVTPVNDAPVAQDVTTSIAGDASLVLVLAATDPDGDAVTISAGTPAHGTLTCMAATCTYRASPGYAGPDGFPFTATDANGGAGTGHVNVTVTPPGTGSGGGPATPAAKKPTVKTSCRRTRPRGKRRATASCTLTFTRVSTGRATATLRMGRKTLASARGTIKRNRLTLRFTRRRAFGTSAELRVTVPTSTGRVTLVVKKVRLR